MNIIIGQINTIVGDVDYNFSLIKETIENGKNADLIIFPELATVGYPPRDLLYREDLIEKNLESKNKIVELTKDIKAAVIFGYVEKNNRNGAKPLFNSACVAQNGKVIQVRHKTLLPTYDVFEEYRYFEPGEKEFIPFNLNGVRVGVIICEEAWNDPSFWKHTLYDVDPVNSMANNGATVIACINSSPFRNRILETRIKMVKEHCTKNGVDFIYANQVGYNDEVGFDGNSFVCNKQGEITCLGQGFREETIYCSLKNTKISEELLHINEEKDIINALTLGVKDYFGKLKIKGPAIIGLSGGIDSAIVAFIATLALGKDRVITVGMPSEFSSDGSVSDAEKIAETLGVRFITEPIKDQHNSLRTAVDYMNLKLTPKSNSFVPCKSSGITDENLQARIRGVYLMALANYHNGIVLSTGNKSEMAVGYCTIYGDMCGGLAVISDVFKTMVFGICEYINDNSMSEIIPWNTINKPPSAELRANQKDQDTLPPYFMLDKIIYKYVDEGKSPVQIYKEMEPESHEYLKKFDRFLKDDVKWVCDAISRNEFKRKQAPTGLKVSQKHFKYGWQQPIVHGLKSGYE